MIKEDADTICAIATAMGRGGIGIVRLSGPEALAIGLISEEVPGDPRALRRRATELLHGAIRGEAPFKGIESGPLQTPDELAEADLGHLSTEVDRILRSAIIEGCRLPLKEGIALEARFFGEVCATQDMRIGVTNFLENGPRTPAKFVNA